MISTTVITAIVSSSTGRRSTLQQLRGRLGLQPVVVDSRTSLERRMDWAISQHPGSAPWLQFVVAMMSSRMRGLEETWSPPESAVRVEPLISWMARQLEKPFSIQSVDTETRRYYIAVDEWFEHGGDYPINWDEIDEMSHTNSMDLRFTEHPFSHHEHNDRQLPLAGPPVVEQVSRWNHIVTIKVECGTDEWAELTYLSRSPSPLERALIRFGRGAEAGELEPLDEVLSRMNSGGAYVDLENVADARTWLCFPQEPVGDIIGNKEGTGLGDLLRFAEVENPTWLEEDIVEEALETICRPLMLASLIHWVKVRNLLLRDLWKVMDIVSDWYHADHPDLSTLSLNSAVSLAYQMHYDEHRATDDRAIEGGVSEAEPVEIRGNDIVLARWPDGAMLVELGDARSFTGEGTSMAHCIGRAGYYDEMLAGRGRYISYRMPSGAPVATVELRCDGRRIDIDPLTREQTMRPAIWWVSQVHGHHNGPIAEEVAKWRLVWWLHEQLLNNVVEPGVLHEHSEVLVQHGLAFPAEAHDRLLDRLQGRPRSAFPMVAEAVRLGTQTIGRVLSPSADALRAQIEWQVELQRQAASQQAAVELALEEIEQHAGEIVQKKWSELRPEEDDEDDEDDSGAW